MLRDREGDARDRHQLAILQSFKRQATLLFGATPGFFFLRRGTFGCQILPLPPIVEHGNSSVSGKMPSKKNGIAADRGDVVPNGARQTLSLSGFTASLPET